MVGIPAALLLVLEGTLRMAHYGRDAGFMIPDEQPGYYRSNPDFVSLFMPASFDLRPLNFRVALRKPANTVRLVVLGESAAQGIPSPQFGFAPQLRAQLRARYPDRKFEVINTGIVAINSHVIYQVARDLAKFEPDLFVIYAGNNEVVGPYGPGCAYLSAMPPLWVIRLSVFVRTTRTGQLLGSVLGRMGRGARPSAEWGGMSMFVDQAVRGDDPRLEKVYQNLALNLADIMQVAKHAGARVLLCTPVSNLKDCAPLLSLHRAGLSGPEKDAWVNAFEQGKLEWRLGDLAVARDHLREAVQLDPLHAEANFLLGVVELAAGETGPARAHFVAAEHWDALRFRPDPRISEVIRNVAARNPATALVDAATELGSDPAAKGVPTGRELMFEHVHLNWEGNFQLGRLLAERAGPLLLDPTTPKGAWLDPAGAAAVLGYSAHEPAAVLRRLVPIVIAPPFTNQATYVEDQARLSRDLARAAAEAADPATLQQAKTLVHSAVAADPQNPDLVKLAEEIDDDLGDLAGALAGARRARELQPASFALATDEAIKLARLERYAEAEALLEKTVSTCTPRDRTLMAPAFADLFVRTKRLAEGRKFFDHLIQQQPAESSLKLLRGRLARLAGDGASAEADFRAVLDHDPANTNATEALVALLVGSGRTADANQVTREAAEHQPRNQPNNFRAALLAEEQSDAAGAIRFLLAAEQSGPVNSGVELHVARKFAARQQRAEALTHLAEARRVATYEGDAAAIRSLDEIIANFRTPPP